MAGNRSPLLLKFIKMKSLAIFLSSFCLLFTACKKKDSGVITPLPTSSQGNLKTIVYQNLPSPYYHFEYDANGRVNKAAFGSAAFTYNLLYQGDKVQEMKSVLAPTKISVSYQYDDAGRISFVKISNEDGSQVFKRGFLTYDNKNRLTELEWELNTPTGGYIVQRTLSFSYYADGNLSEKRDHRHLIDGKQQEALYIDRFEQYDDKVNTDGFSLLHESSEHLVLFPGVKLQHNNPAKLIRTGDGTNYEITYTYSYNNNKKPVQRTGSMLLTNGPQSGQTFQLVATYSYYE
jgi:hypothetical protein